MGFPDDVPTLTDGDVTLRAHRSEDGDAVVEQCTDPVSVRWTTVPPGYTREMAEGLDYLTRVELAQAAGAQLRWAGADPRTDLLLGNVGLPRIHRGNAEIGHWSHPDARGRGVMTEAVTLVLRHAFADGSTGGLGMRRVFLKAVAANSASQQVARANGFREYGRERQAELLGDGSYADLVLFDLLRDEWEARQR